MLYCSCFALVWNHPPLACECALLWQPPCWWWCGAACPLALFGSLMGLQRPPVYHPAAGMPFSQLFDAQQHGLRLGADMSACVFVPDQVAARQAALGPYCCRGPVVWLLLCCLFAAEWVNISQIHMMLWYLVPCFPLQSVAIACCCGPLVLLDVRGVLARLCRCMQVAASPCFPVSTCVC